jgi:hypothetical protein
MSTITSGDTWSGAITLTTNEDWQVVSGGIFLSLNAVPDGLNDGITLNPGDIYQFRAGEVIRHRNTVSGLASQINRQVRL